MVASWHAAQTLAARPKGGLIINMSWDHVLSGMEGRNPQMFAAVKGGVLAFSKSLARSVAPKVRVNVLAPGWISTAFASELDESRRESVAASTPLGRWGTPEDVAAAAVYLASPAAAFLTGQTIFVNGGVVMG
jgi:3-oxoacyl-[acyl-carrier protein] reductase